MTKLMKDVDAFKNEIHGGGTQEKLSFFLIEAIVSLDRATRLLNGILIGVGLIQVWLAWDLLHK